MMWHSISQMCVTACNLVQSGMTCSKTMGMGKLLEWIKKYFFLLTWEELSIWSLAMQFEASAMDREKSDRISACAIWHPENTIHFCLCEIFWSTLHASKWNCFALTTSYLIWPIGALACSLCDTVMPSCKGMCFETWIDIAVTIPLYNFFSKTLLQNRKHSYTSRKDFFLKVALHFIVEVFVNNI